MRIARRSSIFLCALAALTLPTAATGAEDARKPPAEPRVSFFFVEASNGYEAAVVTIGKYIGIEAVRANVSAFYEVPGRVSDSRIDARFGDLGRVSGRYERVSLFGGREGPDENGCEDPASFVSFVGKISFRGEDGYVTIDEPRAGGFLFDPAAQRCRQRARQRSARQSAVRRGLSTHLTAISKQRDVVTSFTVRRRFGQERARLEALRRERRGKMVVIREAETSIGGENALIASGPTVSPPFAFVAAPKPFSGSAVFDPTAPVGSEWTGSLAAWLPGLGKTALTGPDYAIAFCRRAGGESGCDPEAPVAAPSAAPQGSGSQSQLLAEARLSWSRYLRNSASSAGSTP